METTRRFPRTLDEAFPDKIKQSQWLYAPEKETGILEAFTWVIFILGCVGLFVFLTGV